MTTATAPAPVALTADQMNKIVALADTNAELRQEHDTLRAELAALKAASRAAGDGDRLRRYFTPGVAASPDVEDRLAGYRPATLQLAAAVLDSLKRDVGKKNGRVFGGASEPLKRAASAVAGRHVRFNTPDEEGAGAELVETCPLDQLWNAATCDSDILGLFPTTPVKGGRAKIVTVSALPTAYAAQKATDCEGLKCTPSTAVGTQLIEVEASKIKLKLCMPTELEEDAFLDVVSEYTAVAERAIRLANETAILRGDATLAGEANINSLGEVLTIPASGFAPDFTAFDGLAHATLVDNVNNNAANTDWWTPGSQITANHIQKLRLLMEDAALKTHWGFCADSSDLVIVCDYATYAALTQLDDVKFCDKNCDSPTLQTGQLASIWGIPIIPTAALALTDEDGNIDMDAPENNVHGQLHLVNKQGFKVGWARELKMTTTVNDDCDLIEINFSWRLLFARHSSTGNAGGIEAVASIYGISFAEPEA
ncbi:hypothetical protein [uncultured Piscinibacter sp.]|uniref:hypothetical protein n=1 Tax=uncultured Piscinibacter sp. TaxID=1131835 RepID=UPI00262847DC|nr:hypothetical protein [uncultured Piscinibacter sp.]